mgnify:CR=1 FL=1
MRDLKLPQDRHPEKAHKPDNRQPKKPDWIRVKAPVSEGYKATRDIMREHNLVTVCEEAGCPNIYECWGKDTATFMAGMRPRLSANGASKKAPMGRAQ